MKTNRYFAIAIITILISATVWVFAETGNESKRYYITPEEFKNFTQIIKRSKITCIRRSEIDILKKIKPIRVKTTINQTQSEEIKPLNITKEEVQTNVELLFRKYGIEVEAEAAEDVNLNYLNVKVNILPAEGLPKYGLYAFTILVEFHDSVIPVRNPTITIMDAIVWQDGDMGMCGGHGAKHIHNNIENRVKIFINDYLAANPKILER